MPVNTTALQPPQANINTITFEYDFVQQVFPDKNQKPLRRCHMQITKLLAATSQFRVSIGQKMQLSG